MGTRVPTVVSTKVHSECQRRRAPEIAANRLPALSPTNGAIDLFDGDNGPTFGIRQVAKRADYGRKGEISHIKVREVGHYPLPVLHFQLVGNPSVKSGQMTLNGAYPGC